jgi:hypothetical protein
MQLAFTPHTVQFLIPLEDSHKVLCRSQIDFDYLRLAHFLILAERNAQPRLAKDVGQQTPRTPGVC